MAVPDDIPGGLTMRVKTAHGSAEPIHQGSTCVQRLKSVEDAAKYLGVSRASVERLVYRGELPIVKIGGSTRCDLDDLDA